MVTRLCWLPRRCGNVRPTALAYGVAMTSEQRLWEAARTIYSAAPAEFVSVRKQQAHELKQDGDGDAASRAAGFKKPSAAADVVNRLVRQEPDLVDEIDDLGTRLRAAQVEADAATLRSLDGERRELVGRCVTWARSRGGVAGKAPTDATLRDVEQTVWAAIIDAHAAATVRAGVLVTALSAGGFSGVDVTGASALEVEAPDEPARRPRRHPAKTAKPPKDAPPKRPSSSATESAAARKARRALEHALETAQTQAQKRQDELEQVAGSADEAQAQQARLEQQRDRLKAELAEVESDLRSARKELSQRRAEVKTAERERRSAAAAVDRALRDLDEA